jgi:hypothetical protein
MKNEYPLQIERVTPTQIGRRPPSRRVVACKVTPTFIYTESGDKFLRSSGRRVLPPSWRGFGLGGISVDLKTLRLPPGGSCTPAQAVRWGLVTQSPIGVIEAAVAAGK